MAWILGVAFEDELPNLEVAGIADFEMRTILADAELILLTTDARMGNDTGWASPLVMMPNDRSRWSSVGAAGC